MQKVFFYFFAKRIEKISILLNQLPSKTIGPLLKLRSATLVDNNFGMKIKILIKKVNHKKYLIVT